MRKVFAIFLLSITVFSLFIFKKYYLSALKPTPNELAKQYGQLLPTPYPTPTPTPKPLTFAEMNALYGPCVFLPTLFYHHIEDPAQAIQKHQQNLSVETKFFRAQMQFLKDNGYKVVTMPDLVNFFDKDAPISKKSVLLTFDDAYDDFYTNARPILTEFGFKATMFTPTGLIGNPGYLTWNEINEASSGGQFFANHTWSHKNMKASKSVVDHEISTADIQLTEHGLNSPKIFAYPYGLVSDNAKELLGKLGYQAAFTTNHGATLCKKQRLELPRIRVGNASLSFYGL